MFISLVLPVQDLSCVVTLTHSSVSYPGGNCFVSKLFEIHPEQESYLIPRHHVSEVLCWHPWGLVRDLLEVWMQKVRLAGWLGEQGSILCNPRESWHGMCFLNTSYACLELSFLGYFCPSYSVAG